MRRSQICILLISTIVITFLLSTPSHANTSPPSVPDGENILPGEEITMVQMAAEEIIIDVSTEEKAIAPELGSDLTGFITTYNCTYWMVNQGGETEDLAVRFPITSFRNSQVGIGKIEIQSITINGTDVPWTEDNIPLYNQYNSQYHWAHFDVTFPPGEEIEINVIYNSTTSEPSYYHPTVSYVLETGAGWYDTIGTGKIILQMPYNISAENIRTDIGEISENILVWEFTNLEPTARDNWAVHILRPDIWLEILEDREILAETPNDLPALSRLAENIYHAAYRDGPLYEEGLQAIEKAISLAPNEVGYHEQYAHYLHEKCETTKTIENISILFEELDLIAELDPDSSVPENLRKNPSLTLNQIQTVTARAPDFNAAASTPTAPSSPEATQAPSDTPTNRPPLTIILAIAALILVAGSAVWVIKS